VSLSQYSAILLAIYLLLCLLASLGGSGRRALPVEFFIGNRMESALTVSLSVALVSVGGIGLFQHLGLIYRDGLTYAVTSLFVIVVPLVGVLLLSRQWIVSKRFGYVTPGEMLSAYYLSQSMRLPVVFIALIFAIPFVATQLVLGGAVLEYCFSGWVSPGTGVIVFALVMLVYILIGGSRTISLMTTVQFMLATLGVLLASMFVLDQIGGFDGFNMELATLGSQPDNAVWGRTQSGHNSYMSTPGMISHFSAKSISVDTGGPWSVLMLITYLLSFVGIQAAPAISMAAYSSRSTAGLALQSMFVIPVFLGLLIIFGLTIIAVGSHLLQQVPAGPFTQSLTGDGAVFSYVDPKLAGVFFSTFISSSPTWLIAVLGMCAIAVLHASSATFLACGSAIFTRDLVKAFLIPSLNHSQQILSSRTSSGAMVLIAVLMAVFAADIAISVGKMAPALSLQLVPALIGVCWLRWFNRRGVLTGLVTGIIVVLLTDETGIAIVQLVNGSELPWGHWPWSVHSAVWGVSVNIVLVVAISALYQRESTSRHRERNHRYLNDYATRIPRRFRRVPNAWIYTIIWLLFAVGPGLILGNRVFGDPAAGIDGWRMGVPSIWAWQIVWWLGGIGILWFLGYVMCLVRSPKNSVRSLIDDATDVQVHS